jgi:hypothetical protein
VTGAEADDTPRCTAHSSRTGHRCRQRPMAGGTVCQTHGGRAPQVRAAAARRLVTERVTADAAAILAHEGVDPLADPVEALARLASEAQAFKLALAARVNDLSSVRFMASGAGTEQLRSEVALYERALDRTARFLEMLAKLGYEDRRTRVLERDADAVEALCRGLVLALGFQWGDARVQEAWTGQLRLISGGATG